MFVEPEAVATKSGSGAVRVVLAVQGGYWAVLLVLAAVNGLPTRALLITGALAVGSLVLAGALGPAWRVARILALALEVVVAGIGALAVLVLVLFYSRPEDGPVSTTLLLNLGSLGACGALAAVTGWRLRRTASGDQSVS